VAIDKSSVLENEERLIGAMRRDDVGYLGRILHDGLVFMAPNGQVVTKQMDLDSHSRGEMIIESLVPAYEDVRIVEDTATVVVVYETKGTMLGKPIQGRFRYIRVWKEFADGLKVIAGSCFMLGDGSPV